MSECKKTCENCAGRIESILSKDRCDMTRNTIENYQMRRKTQPFRAGDIRRVRRIYVSN